MRPVIPLMLLLAACGEPVLRVHADGTFDLPTPSRRLLLEAPGEVPLSALGPALKAALAAGTMELDARPGISSAPSIVPLRLRVDTSGVAYEEAGHLRMLWRLGESWDIPVARARCGPDGALVFREPCRVRELPSVVEDPTGAAPSKSPPPTGTPSFAILEAGPADRFRDLVLSLAALERRYPGRTVLDLRTNGPSPK